MPEFSPCVDPGQPSFNFQPSYVAITWETRPRALLFPAENPSWGISRTCFLSENYYFSYHLISVKKGKRYIIISFQFVSPGCLFYYALCQLWKSIRLSTTSWHNIPNQHWKVHPSSSNKNFSLSLCKRNVGQIHHKWREGAGGRTDDWSADYSWRTI